MGKRPRLPSTRSSERRGIAPPQPEADDQQRHPSEAEAEIRRINAWLGAQGERGISQLVPMTSHDFQVIGAIIQLYAFADMTARRLLEMIDCIEGVPRRSPNQTLRDNEVFPTLLRRLTALGATEEELAAARTAINMINGFAMHRHHLAHWGARRFPGADAIVAMTKNAREAHRRTGATLAPFEMQYAVIPMPELRSNIRPLARKVDWLAAMVDTWWQRNAGVLERDWDRSRA
jgi:hypothetical protein